MVLKKVKRSSVNDVNITEPKKLKIVESSEVGNAKHTVIPTLKMSEHLGSKEKKKIHKLMATDVKQEVKASTDTVLASPKRRRNKKSKQSKDLKQLQMVPKVKVVGSSNGENNTKHEEHESNTRKHRELKVASGWNHGELLELVNRIDNIADSEDTVTCEERIKTVDWNLICFGGHSAVDCSTAWRLVTSTLRVNKTLREMLSDAKDWLANPQLSSSLKEFQTAQLPGPSKYHKKPRDLFLIAKRKELHEQADSKPMVRKEILAMYTALSEEEKQPYRDMARKLREEHSIEQQTWP